MPSVTNILIVAAASVFVKVNGLTWASCGTGVDCANLEVPLEYGDSRDKRTASIALARYKATVPGSQRLGSLLVNPGGPGASGTAFVIAGAGAAVSVLSGGLYDIIGWDTRGTGSSSPVLECFENAQAEYDFYSNFPPAPNLWLGQFSNSSENARIYSAIKTFDGSAAALADACVKQDSSALYTSSAAYNALDMAAIIDALDGVTSKLNFWGFSYGTVFLVEFIQKFPGRVGRIVADGVFDSKANAETYVSQLPNDQISVRAALNDFAAFCTSAGSEGCSLAKAPSGVRGTVATRIDDIMEDLFKNPLVASGITISLNVLSPVLSILLYVPTTWKALASALSELETRKADTLLSIIGGIADAPPSNPDGPGVGLLVNPPLLCVDNAPSNQITLDQVVSLTKHISIEENTPIINADLTPLAFCRNFPAKRPLLRNTGVSLMAKTDSILAQAKTPILILSSTNDPSTPLKSARALRGLLPNSSKLAIRAGSGHTSISHASLGMAKTVQDFFVAGAMPQDGALYELDQDIFPTDAPNGLVTPPVFKHTYTTAEQSLLSATYNIGLAFLEIA
jgi:pimeloyl-ACP methyl ester carboxylesterase